jgi:hypothetical protein
MPPSGKFLIDRQICNEIHASERRGSDNVLPAKRLPGFGQTDTACVHIKHGHCRSTAK